MIREVLLDNMEVNLLDNLNWEEIAFDTETTSLKQTELEITGMSLCDGKYNYYIPLHKDNRDWWMAAFIIKFGTTQKLIAHNIVFDLRVLHKYNIRFSDSVKFFDTLIAHHLINENSRHGLKYLTRTILHREVADYDEELNHYTKQFYEYALDDSYNTWLLYKEFLPQLKEEGLEYLMFKIEMPFQRILLEMALEGVMIDLSLLRRQQDILQREIFNSLKELHELIGERYTIQISLVSNIKPTIVSNVNFNSSQQLIKMFNKFNLEITETTPSGAPSVGKATLKKHKNHPFVKTLQRYKDLIKLEGFISDEGQIISNLENDGRVRPSFKDFGTKTGRMSSSSPNLQQLPNNRGDMPVKVREVFIAPKSYKMFSCDYSGQEIAVMAQVSKDKTLVKSLNNGYDMHLAIANQFYNLGIPEECLNKKHPDYKKYKEQHGDSRKKAKTITFGLAYGKGAYGFAKDFGISEEEAQEIVDDYFNGMPGLKEAIDKTHKEVVESGSVRSLAGRIRHFNINEDSEFFEIERAKRQSFNFKIQGFSADMIRVAAINVYVRKRAHPEWDLKVIMQIHDELALIVKEEYVDEASRMVKQAFEDTAKKFIVKVNADVEIGDNYGNSK